MNVLAGLYKPEEGSIFVQGKRVNFNSPRDAIAQGLGMVHQHFMLVPSQTVTETSCSVWINRAFCSACRSMTSASWRSRSNTG